MAGKEIWYVIYTKSRHEKTLAEKLIVSGYEVYLPLVIKNSQWSDRKKKVEVPLFNSYIFIKNFCDKDKLKDFKGFVNFLQYNNSPAKVTTREIETLKSIIKLGYDVSEVTDINLLETGSKVMVMAGALKGLVGELITKSDDEWFLINFEQFGNSIQVRVPSRILKKL